VFSHTGSSEYAIDWNMTIGTPFYSARDGVVVDVVEDQWLSKFNPGVCPYPVSESCETPGSDANTIMIRHEDGTWSLYAHFKQNGALVTAGQVITGKTVLGYSGNTGYTTGPHTHFQVTRAATFDNPLGWISETLYVTYVDFYGNVFVPSVQDIYSASPSYPPQLSPVSLVMLPSYPPTANISQDISQIFQFFNISSPSTILTPNLIRIWVFLMVLLLISCNSLPK